VLCGGGGSVVMRGGGRAQVCGRLAGPGLMRTTSAEEGLSGLERSISAVWPVCSLKGSSERWEAADGGRAPDCDGGPTTIDVPAAEEDGGPAPPCWPSESRKKVLSARVPAAGPAAAPAAGSLYPSPPERSTDSSLRPPSFWKPGSEGAVDPVVVAVWPEAGLKRLTKGANPAAAKGVSEERWVIGAVDGPAERAVAGRALSPSSPDSCRGVERAR